MVKVSNTMLAVIAALQSGAHTRRKPIYIMEKSIVSSLYPYNTVDNFQANTPALHSVSVVKVKIEQVIVEQARFLTPAILSVVIKEPIVYVGINDELFKANIPSLTSVELRDVKITIGGNDNFNANIPLLSSVEVLRVAVNDEVTDKANFETPGIISVEIN